MMDREKRRNIIRKIVRFWFRHNLAIAVTLATVFIGTVIAVVFVCVYGVVNKGVDADIDYGYSSDLGDTSSLVSKGNNNSDSIAEGVNEAVTEYVYSTVLQYNESTRDGYMNNCIFLGDSRTVAMVSYGFISDENVLAKVGISHKSVINYTFMQNSGKEYTVAKYLEEKNAPVIYIGFGVNGMSPNDNEKYQQSYKEMVEYVMEHAPESKIVLMAIWPVDDDGPYKNTCQNAWIDNYNNFLISLAEEKGIYYLDVDTVLKTEDGQIKPEYDAGDGLHYRACAYTEILKYIIHHPVPGVSDEGEFVVKYVKPTGQFKTMMKEETKLPDNVQVVDVIEHQVDESIEDSEESWEEDSEENWEEDLEENWDNSEESQEEDTEEGNDEESEDNSKEGSEDNPEDNSEDNPEGDSGANQDDSSDDADSPIEEQNNDVVDQDSESNVETEAE